MDATAGVDEAIEALRAGRPILVHDAADREGETDLIYPAEAVEPGDVARMRNDAGGLVCTAVSHAVAEAWELPFVVEELSHPAAADHELGYDERSSFSLTVNHRDTFTGITDEDRALTVAALGAAAGATAGAVEADGAGAGTGEDAAGRTDGGTTATVAPPAGTDERPEAAGGPLDAAGFAELFRSPGHVHLLRAAPSLSDRQGHTELGVALVEAAGRAPAAVVCEMLDDDTGGALSPATARAYAEREGLVYVEGAAVLGRLA